jgi:ribosome-associated toxin RatA of RatAB toxin-antitoxin module
VTSASHVETISATCERCFAAITDFESYPEWQSAVESVEVRSRDEAGRGLEVSFVIDLKLRRVHYALIYEYTEPTSVRWRYAGGDVQDVTGSYTFRSAGADLIEARYALEVDFGFPVPAPIRNRLQREVMRRSVRELKARVEAMA